jgi:hypothetical protein
MIRTLLGADGAAAAAASVTMIAFPPMVRVPVRGEVAVFAATA